MKIAAINVLPNGSPATIMRGILEVAEKEYQADTISFYGNWKNCPKKYDSSIRFGFRFENYLSAIIAQRFGLQNRGSFFGTLSLLHKLKKFNPDIIHLHNLHLWCINVPILFKYIKKKNIKVVWTLHDCWAFTGRCPHFQIVSCDKWKKGCYKCPYPKNEYPKSLCDNTKKMWLNKKNWFSNVKQMIIVTPSKWLSLLVKESYLNQYPIIVINNGIDLNVFKPTQSNFRNKYEIEDGKKIILGISFNWEHRKGLDVFIELSKKLSDKFQIVLVGTNENVDKILPSNIISIHHTNNKKELCEIYSASDIFVNPTREDNFPTVNIESIACGTPVITFDTGGSAEIIDSTSGITVKQNDINGIIDAIKDICENNIIDKRNCLKRAELFDHNSKYREYIELYNDFLGIDDE